MTPQLRFPEFTDEWQVKKLGDVVDFRNGKAHEKSVTENGKFTIVNSKFISTSGKVRKYSDSQIEPLFSDEIVMVMSDIPNGKALAKCYYIEKSETYTLNQRICALSERSPNSNQFLIYTVNRNKYYLEFDNGVSQTNLRKDEVLACPLHIPSGTEQEKIADFLTAVDERIAVSEKKLERLETYKRGVMQKIFSQQIRFKDENAEYYPEWEEKKLGEIEDEGLIKLGRGNVISKVDIKDYPGEYPIYSSSVKNDGLFGKYGKYMFDEELVTWSVDGGGDFFYRPSQKFSITNVSGWLRVLSGTINCKFLATQLQMLHERQKFDYTSKAHPSVIRNIYTVKIPAIEEQQKITDFLTTLDNKITAEKSKLTAAREFKKALLQKMFV